MYHEYSIVIHMYFSLVQFFKYHFITYILLNINSNYKNHYLASIFVITNLKEPMTCYFFILVPNKRNIELSFNTFLTMSIGSLNIFKIKIENVCNINILFSNIVHYYCRKLSNR